MGEFIKFLPVLAYDGAKMTNISAEDILDFTTAGTSATLLAKRWESALLVNVDNETLNRLLNNPEALAALMKIEGFRSLNADIQTIINKSEAIKKAKKEKGDKLTPKEKKELTEQEKEMKSKRKQIQEKLIKFATRVPVFMYLSEYREKCLKDVITLLEPKLFKLTTGLDVKDFDLLCSLNVFNGETMNQAIWQFKRYEDASLGYTGINRHDAEENVGGWDTVIRKEEFEAMFTAQQKSMAAPKPEPQVFVNQPVTTVPTQKPQTPPAKPSTSTGIPIRPTPQPVVPRQPIQHIPIRPTINTSSTQQKVHMDVSGVGPGTQVIHKSPTLGEGVVVKIDQAKKYIHIKFAGGVKMFTFPDCFDNGFVKLK